MIGMIWKRSRGSCRDCNSPVEEGWAFCPRCGSGLKEHEEERGFGGLGDMFGQIEQQMQRQMQEMDRLFGEGMLERPRIIMPKGGSGISISVNSGPDGKPRVSVNTFGNARKIEPQIKRELGVRNGENKEARPKVTAEPEMKVSNERGRTVYTVSLPEVKDGKDVRIKRLPNSIEIRAKAGDKLYFKLFEAQPQLAIAEQRFSGGKLTLVLEKQI